MTARPALASLIGLAASLAACGGAPTPPTPPPPKPTVAAPAPQPGPLAQAPTPPAAPAIAYEAKGRRDPFETLESREGATGVTVASTRLTGIVRGSRATLALVETADGVGYILKPGDTLGDGRLLEIGADSVVFGIAPKPGSTTNRVTLRLATN